MAIIYLSPSTQEGNFYINGGSEEEYMNLIADKMEPYLRSSGIQFRRNTPDMTAASSIVASNAGDYNLHFALHSNAAPPGREGEVRGSLVFYYPTSTQGRRGAEITANNLRALYPIPSLVKAEPTTLIGEVRKVKAPSVFVELAFHDNLEDATWIKNNLDAAARNLVLSITEYFCLPFLTPIPPRTGMVDVTWGYLNLRERPDTTSKILAQLPDGLTIKIINHWQDWFLIQYKDFIGYVNKDYVTLLSNPT